MPVAGRRGGRPARIHLSLSYPALIGLALLLVAPWVMALVVVNLHPAVPPRDVLRTDEIQGNPGPWGDLIYIPIHISPPLELIEASNGYPPDTQWFFPDTTLVAIQSLFSGADITDAQRSALFAATQASPEINGFVSKPPDDVVRGLAPDARARLYRFLGKFPTNRAAANAFRFCGTADEWLAGSDVRPETRDLIRALSYRNGRFAFFADLGLVSPTLRSPAEKISLIKALSHESTLMMRLRVTDKSEVDSLVAYWGRGGRAKDVRPILESVAELAGAHTVAVPYLLPPFVRSRIYTYPSVADEPDASHRDCHWTALNFFNDPPDDRLMDRAYASKVISSPEYYVIYSGYQLGDLVIYKTGMDEVIHSAVYIADGVLFTKNGSRPSNPWMFIRMEDMKDFYPSDKPLTVQVLRRKGI
jgi:hypothetical protein